MESSCLGEPALLPAGSAGEGLAELSPCWLLSLSLPLLALGSLDFWLLQDWCLKVDWGTSCSGKKGSSRKSLLSCYHQDLLKRSVDNRDTPADSPSQGTYWEHALAALVTEKARAVLQPSSYTHVRFCVFLAGCHLRWAPLWVAYI